MNILVFALGMGSSKACQVSRYIVCASACVLVCVYKRRAHLYKLRHSGAGYVWFVSDSPGFFHQAFQC